MVSASRWWLAGIGAVAIVGAMYFPRLWLMSESGDFPAHVSDAEYMAESGLIVRPHPGFHVATMAAHALLPGISWRAAGVTAALVAALIAAGYLSRLIAVALKPRVDLLAFMLVALIPPAVLLANPLLPWGSFQRDAPLIGYFPASQFHNPTTIASRPAALALFAFCVGHVLTKSGASLPRVFAAATLVVTSILIKPSFVLAFLPALGLIALTRVRLVSWRMLILGVGLPAAMLLMAQFYGRYYAIQETAGTRIVWAPLYVISLYSAVDPLTLLTKLSASVMFPIVVTVLFFHEAAGSIMMRLAWLTFACGAALGYVLAEGGKESAGDFLWSGQLGAFVLFAVSAVFLAERLAGRDGGRIRLAGLRAACCVTVLALHAVSGVRHFSASYGMISN